MKEIKCRCFSSTCAIFVSCSLSSSPSALAELDKVAQWLSYPDSSPKLSRLLDDRAEGTGSWFLDGDVFTAFREGKSSTKFVLLSGKGKFQPYDDDEYPLMVR